MLLLGAWHIQPWGQYRVWKGALQNKRLHKNKWFLNIILTGINPTTLDFTGSTGFVMKNHKYFSSITIRICKCKLAKLSFFETPCILVHEQTTKRAGKDQSLIKDPGRMGHLQCLCLYFVNTAFYTLCT